MADRTNQMAELTAEEVAQVQGGRQQEYLTITLKDCMVTSWQ